MDFAFFKWNFVAQVLKVGKSVFDFGVIRTSSPVPNRGFARFSAVFSWTLVFFVFRPVFCAVVKAAVADYVTARVESEVE